MENPSVLDVINSPSGSAGRSGNKTKINVEERRQSFGGGCKHAPAMGVSFLGHTTPAVKLIRTRRLQLRLKHPKLPTIIARCLVSAKLPNVYFPGFGEPAGKFRTFREALYLTYSLETQREIK